MKIKWKVDKPKDYAPSYPTEDNEGYYVSGTAGGRGLAIRLRDRPPTPDNTRSIRATIREYIYAILEKEKRE